MFSMFTYTKFARYVRTASNGWVRLIFLLLCVHVCKIMRSFVSWHTVSECTSFRIANKPVDVQLSRCSIDSQYMCDACLYEFVYCMVYCTLCEYHCKETLFACQHQMQLLDTFSVCTERLSFVLFALVVQGTGLKVSLRMDVFKGTLLQCYVSAPVKSLVISLVRKLILPHSLNWCYVYQASRLFVCSSNNASKSNSTYHSI